MRYSKENRLVLNASDPEGEAAIAWAHARWRSWNCGEHEQPRSASGLLRDLLIHAHQRDEAGATKPPRPRRGK